MFYELLKKGCKILITDRTGHFCPALFWLQDGEILVYNDELGTCQNREFTQDPAKLAAHIEKMLFEYGHTVEIRPPHKTPKR